MTGRIIGKVTIIVNTLTNLLKSAGSMISVVRSASTMEIPEKGREEA